jgi:hypothetical protein
MIMNSVWRTVGVLVVTIVAALSANSQEVTKAQSTEPVVVDSQTTTPPAYVFPSERERFKRYVKGTIGPFRFARTAASAGIDQWRDHPEEWGQGAKGYGRRFASSLGQNAIQQTVTYGLDEAMCLDTGFERSKREGFFPRMKDALIQNVTSRTKSGKRVVSVPRFAGAYTGAIISHETWYPERYSYKNGLRSGTKSLLTGFGINVFREFVINW